MSRILAAGLGLVLGLNAPAMLFASLAWFDAVPGVRATGAYNPHFVRDIGAAYLAAAAGLARFAWRPRQGWPALATAALFLTLHAGVQVFDVTCSANPLADFLRDLPGVYAPAALAVWLAVARRPGP